MIKQTSFHLTAKRRGCHLVTQEVLETILNHLVKERVTYSMEGSDDMPAHAKCSLFGFKSKSSKCPFSMQVMPSY